MDLTSHYLGLTLKGPLVPSASPFSRSLDAARALEDAGAGAIIMHSLFGEAVNEDSEAMVRFLHHQEIGSAEAASFLPDRDDFPSALDLYLEQLRALKGALDIPVRTRPSRAKSCIPNSASAPRSGLRNWDRTASLNTCA